MKFPFGNCESQYFPIFLFFYVKEKAEGKCTCIGFLSFKDNTFSKNKQAISRGNVLKIRAKASKLPFKLERLFIASFLT